VVVTPVIVNMPAIAVPMVMTTAMVVKVVGAG
jgi:hypothetical protein